MHVTTGWPLFTSLVFFGNGLQSLRMLLKKNKSSELADSHPPSEDLTSGKNPTSSGSKCGESGGASSSGIPFLVKYKV